MEICSDVASFISSRIQTIEKPQKDIAREAGFKKPNMITMIKQGKTRLPLDKVGPMALALDTEPAALFKMCMEEYHPETGKAIAPFMESLMTEDERRLLTTLRDWVGGPFLAALNDESRTHFDNFLSSLRGPSTVSAPQTPVYSGRHTGA